MAAWGEYKTGDYEEDSFVMVTLGTGIGGGIILNGQLWPGINGAAAEFGHMSIACNGVPCTCGRNGCFEAMASANAAFFSSSSTLGIFLKSSCIPGSSRISLEIVYLIFTGK